MTATTPAVDPALIDMMNAVFAEHRDTLSPATSGPRALDIDTTLWRRLDSLGLVRLTGSEAAGGSGAGWWEAAELIAASVAHGVRIPLAEHDLLAGWLLEAIGMPTTVAARTVAVIDGRATAVDVPWASAADRIVLVWQDTDTGYRAADVATGTLQITPGANLIGEPRDAVHAATAALAGAPVPRELVDTLRLKSALVRGIQVNAALDQILRLCLEHVTSRVQFGRPLAAFQAVQHLVADVAAEAALARAATEVALSTAITTAWSAPNLEFLIAVARSCCGHAASVVVRNAHQLHGAIGTTREHRLHEFTRAALAWRSEFGTVRYWDDWLSHAAHQAGPDGLWATIAH